MTNRLTDKIVFWRYFILIWVKAIRLFITHNPVKVIRLFFRYPWLRILLKVCGFYARLCRDRHGRYLEGVAMTFVDGLVEYVAGQMEDVFLSSKKVILLEAVLSREMFKAMGFNTYLAELHSMLMPLVSAHALEPYIDKAENYGVPADLCSYHKGNIGVLLSREYPDHVAMVTSNAPCDQYVGMYAMMEMELGLPVYRIDIPYHFTTERATDYVAEELRDLIRKLEQDTSGRMDWNRLREMCEERNRSLEVELELWETLRVKPAPLAAEAVYLAHWVVDRLGSGDPSGTLLYKKLLNIAKENLREGIGALPHERYRLLLWNVPPFHFTDIISWAEQKWGVALIMEALSYNRLSPIDTSSQETMLRGIAKTFAYGPMGRHSRGPVENFLNDMFHAHKVYNIDMIWAGANIGCKKTAALFGILRERCRAANIPLLILNFDIMDPRTITPDNIKEQVRAFMENTMGAGH